MPTQLKQRNRSRGRGKCQRHGPTRVVCVWLRRVVVFDPRNPYGLIVRLISTAYVSPPFDNQVHQGKFQRVDIMHYEISSMGHFNRPWADARKRYRGIMRDPDKINFLTVIREPRAHFIRYLLPAGLAFVPHSLDSTSHVCTIIYQRA